jgi:hypothetical protein
VVQPDPGADQPQARDPARADARAGRQDLQAQRQDRHAAGAPARLAPGREARDGRRRACLGRHLRLRAVHVPQRQGADRARRGPYFYLPKMESHLEARLWNDIFVATQTSSACRRARSRRRC